MKKCYPTILDDASDMSVHDTDHVEKFVLSPKIRALNDHTKHCMIQCYYTMNGMCKISAVADIVVGISCKEARYRI